MELIELKVSKRTSVGNGPARTLRRTGQIPAVLYGPGTEPVLLSVAIGDLEEVLKKRSASQVLLNLTILNNGDTINRSAMIKELQTHPVSREHLHVDFYEIAMDRKITVKIPVVAKGKAKGVENGGVLQIIRRELEVWCLPREIPEAIEVDVTDLDIGDSIHVKEIPLIGNIEIPEEGNFTVITIVSPKAEEEVPAEAEEAEEAEATEEESKAESEE